MRLRTAVPTPPLLPPGPAAPQRLRPRVRPTPAAMISHPESLSCPAIASVDPRSTACGTRCARRVPQIGRGVASTSAAAAAADSADRQAGPEGPESVRGLKVVVAGGGNAAHVAVGMFAHQGADVGMFVSFPEEAEEIRAGVEANGGLTVHMPGDTYSEESSYTVMPSVISSDPAEVIPGAQLVVIITPAFAHEPILRQIEPYVHHEVFVGAVPAPGGFQWMAEHILRDTASGLTVFGGDHLPWACRVEQRGKSVSLLGVKSHVDVCVHPHGHDTELFQELNSLFVGTTYTDGGHFLNCTLFPTNCIIHPGIMYGLWKDWDGKPVGEAPLFYQGLSQETADVLQGLSDDIQATKKKLEAELGIDLSNTLPLYDYQMDVYGHNIDDPSSIRSMFATNHAFRGLTCPMLPAQDGGSGGLVPNFRSRYLTEDLPHGLAVLKGVADIAGVDTPHFDAVLSWAQEKAGAVYMVDGKIDVSSPDVQKSGCPQRWGYTSIEDFRDSVHDPQASA